MSDIHHQCFVLFLGRSCVAGHGLLFLTCISLATWSE